MGLRELLVDLKGKIVVITGAANGIGRALAIRFATEGAQKIICADIDVDRARDTAKKIGGIAQKVDVAEETEILALIDKTETNVGPIDLFCSNAGISLPSGINLEDEGWQRIWKINLMAHVWATRHLVPRMIKRGGGYFLNTASAAGLLNQIGSAPYGVTKHAAVGFAEWVAITYGDQGIKISLLCPQAVRTEMILGHEDHVASIDGVLTPEEVAESCVAGLREETFLILPHIQVKDYIKKKANNYDRWIAGMRRLNRQFGTFQN